MAPRWLPIVLMPAMCMPGRIQAQSPDHFALTALQVARALCERGIQTQAKQVSLLARVVATEPEPALDILSVETLGDTQPSPQSRVKLACRLPGTCLPFYAIVNWPRGTGLPATIASSISPVVRNAPLDARTVFTMRAGTRATLVMDDDRSHIQVTVISLENGMAGHWIRVSSPDHKQVYFGEVVSPSLLKGSF
jgi:hypothetical protein